MSFIESIKNFFYDEKDDNDNFKGDSETVLKSIHDLHNNKLQQAAIDEQSLNSEQKELIEKTSLIDEKQTTFTAADFPVEVDREKERMAQSIVEEPEQISEDQEQIVGDSENIIEEISAVEQSKIEETQNDEEEKLSVKEAEKIEEKIEDEKKIEQGVEQQTTQKDENFRQIEDTKQKESKIAEAQNDQKVSEQQIQSESEIENENEKTQLTADQEIAKIQIDSNNRQFLKTLIQESAAYAMSHPYYQHTEAPEKTQSTRPSWDEYFINIAHEVSKRATCDRGRSGCVIVKDNQILVAGYVGSPIGLPHCDDVGHILRKTIREDGTISEHCVRTVHAEQNAICQAARRGISIDGATLYCRMTPCRVCAMLIINCGIKRVVCERKYQQSQDAEEMFKQSNIELTYIHNEVQEYNKN